MERSKGFNENNLVGQTLKVLRSSDLQRVSVVISNLYPTYLHILLIGVGPSVTLYDSVSGDRWEELPQVTAVSPAPLLLPHCWQVSQHWLDLIYIKQPHDYQWHPEAWSIECDQALLLSANQTAAWLRNYLSFLVYTFAFNWFVSCKF